MNFKTPYQPQEFQHFLNQFLPHYDELNEAIHFHFQTRFIQKAKLKGRVSPFYETNLKNLAVIEFSHDSENDPRTGITQDAFRILKGLNIDRALGIFYSPMQDSYRFSLLSLTSFLDGNQKLQVTLSNPKRFSFLLGPKAKVKTAQKQLSLPVSSYEDLTRRFSVEAVNKEFYEKIRGFFSRLAGGQNQPLNLSLPVPFLENKNIYQEFAVRLIGRLIFCWFLKEKKSDQNKSLLPETLLSSQTVKQNPGFYHEILENLFFEVLNKKQENRPEEVRQNTLFQTIPFLNGGLFDHHPHDFYQSLQKNYALKIEDQWFCDFFDFLLEYNFTVDENTSSHQEISVDPEMLGRIFENLLAEINPETGESARKSTGSFYTPRPIVDYMIQASLHQYLISYVEKPQTLKELQTGFETEENQVLFEDSAHPGLIDSARHSAGLKLKEKIQYLIESNFEALETYPFLPYERKILKSALKELKILDPACGSGAFPMGVLQKIMEIHRFLQPSEAEMKEALKKSAPQNQEEELNLSPGDFIVYKPYDSLNIRCRYEGKGVFLLTVNGKSFGNFRVNDLTVFVKNLIEIANAQRGVKTIANLFSQGHIERANGETTLSFNALRSKTPLSRIVCRQEKLPLWQYQNYENTKKTTRPAFNQSEENALEDSEYLNALYDYRIKEQVIENTLFGVDIQPVAVEIARLRCFLSLVVEERVIEDHPAQNRGIVPLPNLAFKFVCANTLISLEDPKDKEEENLFTKTAMIEQLAEIRKAYFHAAHEEKETIKKKFISLQNQLNGFGSETQQRLYLWNPFSDDPSGWFDPFWMLGVKDGFDVVIGNPPYVSNKGTSEKQKTMLKRQFGFTDDLYFHFIVKSIGLLKDGGMLSFITSNTFWTIQSKKELRKIILNKRLFEIYNTANPFDSAMVDTCILSVKNEKADSYQIKFKDGSKNLNNPEVYEISVDVYKKAVHQVFFKPDEKNLKIYKKYNSEISKLMDLWWDKISTSKNISKNQKELEQYRNSLKPGDITLLGLLTEGGQGLATANNGKFIAVMEGTKTAENILKSRPLKFFEAINSHKIKEYAGINTRGDAENFLNRLSEKEIWAIFDEIKEKYGRDVFGQGYLFRIIKKTDIADVDLLTEGEKKNGISQNIPTFVPYDKGDKDGNRWHLESPFYIDWSEENLKKLKTDPKARWQGYDFFFREGFCWSDINTVYLKCRLKSKSIHDVKSMSLFSLIPKIPDWFFVCIINSKFVSEYVEDFVNNTQTFQINDARQLPIVMPNENQLKDFESLFDTAFKVKQSEFSRKIDDCAAEAQLKDIQEKLDKKVLELYGFN